MKAMKFNFIIKLVILLSLIATFSYAETVTVITKENAIREFPRFFAPVKSLVKYNDILEVITKEGDWFKVKFKNKIGYIHKTAVERRTALIRESSLSKKTGTTEGEITLAGKGFNPQVEKAYKEKYPEMRYDIVDKVERYDVSDKDLVSFIRAGGLSEPK
ncbi:MAG: SH3 domain-containing protein [Thermodesulfovibrio sp.]|nr:SH3 domain-containing protein [Thermodesulfovibrio sp.]